LDSFSESIESVYDKQFKFKIKITHTDLAYNDTFFRMMAENFAMSSFSMMSQNSSYISKLNFINNYEGGTVAGSNSDDSDADRVTAKPAQDKMGNNVFRVTVANPEIAEEIRAKKEKVIRERISEKFNAIRAAKLTNETNGTKTVNDDTDLEDVDILESLNAFEELTVDADFTDANGDFPDDFGDEFEFEDYDGYNEYEENGIMADGADIAQIMGTGKVEMKFDAPGSIKFISDSLLEVKYDESEVTGIRDSYVRFLFDMKNKNFVSINRGEDTDIWLDCEKGKRISLPKRTRHTGYIITVNTKELINTMTPDGGQLYIQYIRETNGSPAEIVSHSLSAVPVNEICPFDEQITL